MASTLRTDPHQEFLALLCADEDLVRAEFEAIIEANWDEPEPPPPTPTPPGRPGRGRSAVPVTPRPGLIRRGGRVVWCRGRSPPGTRLDAAVRTEQRKDGDR